MQVNAAAISETATTVRVRNMVFANKKERQAEKQVCQYIIKNVLNQGQLTKITGISTKKDLDREARARFEEQQRSAEKEAVKQEKIMKMSEVF